MPKLKYLYEDFDLARECLALYDHDPGSLAEIQDRLVRYHAPARVLQELKVLRDELALLPVTAET